MCGQFVSNICLMSELRTLCHGLTFRQEWRPEYMGLELTALHHRYLQQHYTTSYSVVQERAASYRSMQHHTASYSIIQQYASSYRSMQHHTEACSIIQHHSASYSSMQHHTASYSIIQQHATSYSIIQHHTAACNIIQQHATLSGNLYQCTVSHEITLSQKDKKMIWLISKSPGRLTCCKEPRQAYLLQRAQAGLLAAKSPGRLT